MYITTMQVIVNKHNDFNECTHAALNLSPYGKHLHSNYYSFIYICILFGKQLCGDLELSARCSTVHSPLQGKWLSVRNSTDSFFICLNNTTAQLLRHPCEPAVESVL